MSLRYVGSCLARGVYSLRVRTVALLAYVPILPRLSFCWFRQKTPSSVFSKDSTTFFVIGFFSAVSGFRRPCQGHGVKFHPRDHGWIWSYLVLLTLFRPFFWPPFSTFLIPVPTHAGLLLFFPVVDGHVFPVFMFSLVLLVHSFFFLGQFRSPFPPNLFLTGVLRLVVACSATGNPLLRFFNIHVLVCCVFFATFVVPSSIPIWLPSLETMFSPHLRARVVDFFPSWVLAQCTG